MEDSRRGAASAGVRRRAHGGMQRARRGSGSRGSRRGGAVGAAAGARRGQQARGCGGGGGGQRGAEHVKCRSEAGAQLDEKEPKRRVHSCLPLPRRTRRELDPRSGWFNSQLQNLQRRDSFYCKFSNFAVKCKTVNFTSRTLSRALDLISD